MTAGSPRVAGGGSSRADWRGAPFALVGGRVTLRPLVATDVPALLAIVEREEVCRYMAPPPDTLEGAERFVAWTRRERSEGRGVTFGIVPEGRVGIAGIFQVRRLDAAPDVAEWGVALAPGFWGTGVYLDASRLAVDFAFGTIGVRRLVARSAVENTRANAAIRKIGAVKDGVRRGSLRRNGRPFGQYVWTMADREWVRRRAALAGSP